jgi:beta-galactosidase/beta-glucuronidase
VPYALESALSGVGRGLKPEERLWYRRSFEVPAAWKGQRIMLRFEAVDFACAVWVNGGLVGDHRGGSDPFGFDITPFLRAGANEVVVGVTDPTDTGEQPRGKQQLNPRGIWYTPVSGIWQTVWLEPVPEGRHLVELVLIPEPKQERLRVRVLVDEATGDDTYAARVTARAGAKVVGTTLMRVNREGLLPVPGPRLWSPDDPFLYDLDVELVRVAQPYPDGRAPKEKPRHPAFGETERTTYAAATVNGEPLDRVRSYFAMRWVDVGEGHVFQQPVLRLNGRPLFQHGPLDQGWWPESLLTPPSDEAMAWEIAWLRRAGFNMLRKHIKIEPRRYYYHCDRLGMLVWQDMPSGFNQALRNHPADEGEPIRRLESAVQQELELRRMIGNLRNHPSIVMWVIHNEGWGQYETAALDGWVRALDPTRWVNATSGWFDLRLSDVYDVHSYHPEPLRPKRMPDRAIVLGEYGGVGWPIQNHLWNPAMRNWGYQTYQDEAAYASAVEKKMAALLPMIREDAMCAAVYTQTTDVEGEVNGFLTYDRRFEKLTPERLRALNEPLRLPR